MFLQKLKALHKHLERLNLVDCNQIDSYVENAKIQSSGKNNGEDITVCYVEYDAVYSIEKLTQHPALLIASFSAWLQSHDDNRNRFKLDDPNFDVDLNHDGSSDIEFSVPFIEEVRAVLDPGGALEYSGDRYRIDSVEPCVAESIEIIPSVDKTMSSHD